MIIQKIFNEELNELYTFKVKPDKSRKNKFYCVMQNPFNSNHDTKVIYGGSEDIVCRKIIKQYEKLKGEIDDESNY